MALRGIDISRHQGTITWPLVAPHVDEVLIRATMGAVGVDPLYAANWQGAAQAGIARRGIYHLATSRTPWRGQYENVLRVTGGDFGPVAVTLDVERTAADRASPLPFPRQQYTDDLLELAVALRREAPGGVRVYSNATEIRAMTTQVPALQLFGFHGAGYPLTTPMTFERLAQLWPAYHLVIPAPWKPEHLAAWQGAFTGRLPGIAGNVDMSLVFAVPPAPEPVPDAAAMELAARARAIVGLVSSSVNGVAA
jgi:hypothetical protein